MVVAIVNYGCGNLHSVLQAVDRVGGKAKFVTKAEQIEKAEKVILPGVGAFSPCMAKISAMEGMIESLRSFVATGRPFLGICVGMQIMATHGDEGVSTKGLDLIAGRVRRLDRAGMTLKIPHMGWNTLSLKRPHPLVEGLDNKDVYFAHSYVFNVDRPDCIRATCTHGEAFPAVIAQENIVATQFHPEKSQVVGLRFLKNFITWDI